jgi:hypothetical protein
LSEVESIHKSGTKITIAPIPVTTMLNQVIAFFWIERLRQKLAVGWLELS